MERNVRMADSGSETRSLTRTILDPWVLGTICGLVAAVGYTATNAFLRTLSHCDPFWVSAVKTTPTALLLSPWFLVIWQRGERLFPPWRTILLIIAASLCGQLIGNVMFQLALGEVGLALTVPLCLGGMIVTASILARLVLHEPLTVRSAAALGVLILAIVVLSLGANKAHQSIVSTSASLGHVALGVGAGILAGMAFAVLNVTLRYAITQGATLTFNLVTVSIVGIIALGIVSSYRIGWDGIWQTPADDFCFMLLAGVGNAISFLALTASLRLTNVVYFNALNATQAAMAAVAGVMFFHEPLSPWLVWGVACTAVGLMILRPRSVGIRAAKASAFTE